MHFIQQAQVFVLLIFYCDLKTADLIFEVFDKIDQLTNLFHCFFVFDLLGINVVRTIV